MAPTDNVPSFCPQESNNLLSFVSTATVDITTALGKQSKKRTVNIKKYAQRRVKRLEQGKGRRGAATASQTKSKSALLSPPSAKQHVAAVSSPRSLLESRNSCPELNLPPAAPRTIAVATSSYSTYSSHPPMQYSYSDSNLHPSTSGTGIDDYLAAILSLDEQPSCQQPVSSRHTSCSVTPCLTPQPPLDLEPQVGLTEHPYSPYSDCYSDEFYGDSAYSSHNCSPVAPPTCTADWNSSVIPVTMPVDYSNNCWSSSALTTTSCSWIPDCSPLTVTAPMPVVFDQGPPATPTVEQVLSEWGSYQ